MEQASLHWWCGNSEVCFSIEQGRRERDRCPWNPLAALSESCFEVPSRFQQHACTWKRKTLDRAGVFECELALASKCNFFGCVTTILPICSPKQIFVKEELQLGDLSCFVKNGLRVGEERGFPVSRRGECYRDTYPRTGTEEAGTVHLQPKRSLHHRLRYWPELSWGIWGSGLLSSAFPGGKMLSPSLKGGPPGGCIKDSLDLIQGLDDLVKS